MRVCVCVNMCVCAYVYSTWIQMMFTIIIPAAGSSRPVSAFMRFMPIAKQNIFHQLGDQFDPNLLTTAATSNYRRIGFGLNPPPPPASGFGGFGSPTTTFVASSMIPTNQVLQGRGQQRPAVAFGGLPKPSSAGGMGTGTGTGLHRNASAATLRRGNPRVMIPFYPLWY